MVSWDIIHVNLIVIIFKCTIRFSIKLLLLLIYQRFKNKNYKGHNILFILYFNNIEDILLT